MSSDTSLGFEARLCQADVWLDQARRDCRVVKLLLSGHRRGSGTRYAETSVYLLQQSVEKAVKSLMVAAGEDEKKFRNQIGHNSLKAIMNFLEPRVQSPMFSQFMDNAPSFSDGGVPDAREADNMFNRVARMARRDEFRELAILRSDEIRPLIRLMTMLHSCIESKTRELLPSNMALYDISSQTSGTSDTKTLWNIVEGLLKEPENISDEIVRVVENVYDLITPQLLEELRETSTPQTFSRRQLLSDMILPLLFVIPSLYLLAALTYPHEAYTRYPAPYGTPKDPREAIENKGTLGTQHYTSELGIVTLLPDMHKWTQTVLDNMPPLLKLISDPPIPPNTGFRHSQRL